MLDVQATEAATDTTARVLESAHEAYVATDAEGRITAWNPAAERTFGWAREEVTGHRLSDTIVPEAYRTAHESSLHRFAETREAHVIGRRLELEAVDRDGRVFPIELTISALEDACGELSFHAFLHDITERRVAAADHRLAAIVESSADAILATDENACVTDWNPAAERLFGWPRDEILGRPVAEIVPDHLTGESAELWRRAREGDPIIGHETERRHRDGGPVYVELTVARIGEGATPVACSAIYRDVGARKRAELELADHTARLQSIAAAERRATRAQPAESPRLRGLEGPLIEGIVALAHQHVGLDVAWVSELSGEEQTFGAIAGAGARFGLTPGLTIRREDGVCDQMIAGAVPQVIGDLRRIPSVARLPAVRETGAVSYVGVPIRLADGRVVGSLCVAGRQARATLGRRHAADLQALAGIVTEHLEEIERQAGDSRTRSEFTAVEALLAALDARDHYTGEHSHAVVELSRTVATALGLGDQATEAVGQVALLHDLGKVGVPDAILQKPGKLTDTEWELMREHPAIGARIVAAIDPLAHLAPACRAEHERWDGRGYPDGLAGERIPVAARITLACDAYHAMMSDRPYRQAIGHDAAVAELRDNAGSQFDPEVVAALMTVLAS